jgi:hypothetical protein
MITAAEFIGIDNYLFMFFKDHLFWQSVAVMSI